MDNIWTVITRVSLLIMVFLVYRVVSDMLVGQRLIYNTLQQILKELKEQKMQNQELADAQAKEDTLLNQIDDDVNATESQIKDLQQQKQDLIDQINNTPADSSSVEQQAELVRTNREIERLQSIHAALTLGQQDPNAGSPAVPEATMTTQPINAGAIAPNPLAGSVATTQEDDAGAGPANAESNADNADNVTPTE